MGDYTATVFSGGKAFPIFAAAQANTGTLFDEPMFSTTTGFQAAQHAAVLTSAAERPVHAARSDHPAAAFYDQEHRYKIVPERR